MARFRRKFQIKLDVFITPGIHFVTMVEWKGNGDNPIRDFGGRLSLHIIEKWPFVRNKVLRVANRRSVKKTNKGDQAPQQNKAKNGRKENQLGRKKSPTGKDNGERVKR